MDMGLVSVCRVLHLTFRVDFPRHLFRLHLGVPLRKLRLELCNVILGETLCAIVEHQLVGVIAVCARQGLTVVSQERQDVASTNNATPPLRCRADSEAWGADGSPSQTTSSRR